jgi:hypothetical protein
MTRNGRIQKTVVSIRVVDSRQDTVDRMNQHIKPITKARSLPAVNLAGDENKKEEGLIDSPCPISPALSQTLRLSKGAQSKGTPPAPSFNFVTWHAL